MSLGTLGRYELIREIARSNDIVYEAWDPQLDRRVALKELRLPDGISEKDKHARKERFKREARAAGRLEHPNIVSIYEVGEENGRSYIVMEYLEGETLRQRMDREGKITPEDAVKIFDQVLDGLAFAHENGVVHRDIKPENIQLLPDGRVVITDFGIARLQFEPSITVDGQIFGTPSYMSPEQVVGRDVDPRTDVWSCGVVLYEMLSGQKPFTGDTVVTISHRILHAEPAEIDGVPWAIAHVVRKAISKDPEDRYSSAKELKAALNDALQGALTDSMGPPSPWGPPLDPYSAQSPYTYGTSQPPGTGAPSPPPPPGGYAPTGASPYGQPYGASFPPNMPMPPFPPGWVNPPKRPLLSPEASEFLLRTLIVVLIGGVLLATAVGTIAWLDRRSQEATAAKVDQALADEIAKVERLIPSDPLAAQQQLTELRRRAQSHATRERIERLLCRAYLERARRLLDAGTTDETLRQAAGLAQRAAEMAGEDGQATLDAGKVLYDIATRTTDPQDRFDRLTEALRALEVAFNSEGQVRSEAGTLLARTCLQIALLFDDNKARSSLYLNRGIYYAEQVGNRELADDLRLRL